MDESFRHQPIRDAPSLSPVGRRFDHSGLLDRLFLVRPHAGTGRRRLAGLERLSHLLEPTRAYVCDGKLSRPCGDAIVAPIGARLQ